MSENTGRTTRSGNKAKHPGQVVLDADQDATKALEREQEADEQAIRDEAADLRKRLAKIEKRVQKDDSNRRALSTKPHAGQKRTMDTADVDSDEQAGEEGAIVDLASASAESEPNIVPIRGREKGKERRTTKKPPVSNITTLPSLVHQLRLSNLQTPKTKAQPPRKKAKKKGHEASDADGSDGGNDIGIMDVNAPSKTTKNKVKANAFLLETLTLKLFVIMQTPKPKSTKKRSTLQTEVAMKRAEVSSDSENEPRYDLFLISHTYLTYFHAQYAEYAC